MSEVLCWRPPVIRKWQLGATESVQIVLHRVQGTFHISSALCGNYFSVWVEHVCNNGEDTRCYWDEPRKLLYPGWQQHSILNSCLCPQRNTCSRLMQTSVTSYLRASNLTTLWAANIRLWSVGGKWTSTGHWWNNAERESREKHVPALLCPPQLLRLTCDWCQASD